MRTTTLLPILLLLALLVGCEPEPVPPAGEEEAADTGPSVTNVTVAEGDVSIPTTAVDPNTGAVYWAWFGEAEGATQVYLARLDSGSGTPSVPVQVNQGSDVVNKHRQAPAQVAVGPEGTVYVAWTTRLDLEGERFPASNLLLSRSTDGGRSFGSAVAVNDDADGLPAGHTFHSIAVGPEGNVYAAWLDGRVLAQARAGRAGGEYTPVRRVALTPGAARAVRHDPGTEVRVARSTDGGQHFGENIVLAKDSCECCRTVVSVAADGSVYVAWRHIFGDNIRDMALVRSDDGGQTFSEPIRIHEDNWQINGCPHSGPSLAVDTQGRVHAAWYTGAEQAPGLFYAVSEDRGTRFGTPDTLVAGVPISQTALAADAEGGVWLAWEDATVDGLRLCHTQMQQAESLPGAAPALATGAGVQVATWTEEGAIKARITRD